MSDENKIIRIELEWSYAPEELLEEKINQNYEGVELIIDKGVAKAEIKPGKFEDDRISTQKLTNFIKSRLQAAQLLKYKDFDLKGPTRTDIKANGKKIYYLIT